MDASLEWAKKVLNQGGPAPGELWAFIPVYNIGGSLKRRPHTRANQNGPELQGFRGNARNLDLNRDFIKADALNTFSFYAIFHSLRPQIFIDTHTSNGADYPYTISLISTLKDKLAPPMAKLMGEDLEPFLYQEMKARNWEMIPYVNVFGSTPDEGYAAFLESPRYASGYTALFHSLGFITETHMFKPYEDRVEATYQFLESMAAYCLKNKDKVEEAYQAALTWEVEASKFPIDWTLDSTVVQELKFKAYGHSYQPSTLGNYKRLAYDRSATKELTIDYFPSYRATKEAHLPKYYLIPQAWTDLIQRLQYHNIEMRPLNRDSLIEVKSAYLRSWNHQSRPYEGHFRTSVDSVEWLLQKRLFYEGDYLVNASGVNRYFLATVLDPQGRDSYLSWGFFNIIFQQKEYFSPYIFEDEALKMLEENPKLAEEFETWKASNPRLLGNAYGVLQFFYQRSDFYEPEHLRYPIGYAY